MHMGLVLMTQVNHKHVLHSNGLVEMTVGIVVWLGIVVRCSTGLGLSDYW